MRQLKHRTTSTYVLKLTKCKKPFCLYDLTHTTGVYYGLADLITNKGYKSNYARKCMPQLRLKVICSI